MTSETGPSCLPDTETSLQTDKMLTGLSSKVKELREAGALPDSKNLGITKEQDLSQRKL